MKRALGDLILMADMGGQFGSAIAMDQPFCVRPKDQDGKEAIMEGNYPDEFNLFLSIMKNSDTNVSVEHVEWYKDKKDPRLMVTIRTRHEE